MNVRGLGGGTEAGLPSPAEAKVDPLEPAGLRSDREEDRLSGRERDDNRDALRDRRDVFVELLGVGVPEVHKTG